MKILIFPLLLLLQFQFTWAQVPVAPSSHPEWLGMTTPGQYGTSYATLFEEGGGRFYFSCRHWKPEVGETLIFGNKAKGVVKKNHFIRLENDQYDIIIGELEDPVSANPIKTWWIKPPDWIQNQITVKGYAYEGWFDGIKGSLNEATSSERSNGLWYKTQPTGIVKFGYSGSPCIYTDTAGNQAFVGVNWALWGDSNNSSGGVATPVYKVYREFFTLFPQFLHPPANPETIITLTSDRRIKVCFKGNPNYRLTCSTNLQQGTWFPVGGDSAFGGYEPLPRPGEQIFWWNPSGPQMFFRGEL